MPAVRKEILRFLASDICKKMGRKKTYDGDIMETPLNRCLSTFEITLLGELYKSSISQFSIDMTSFLPQHIYLHFNI